MKPQKICQQPIELEVFFILCHGQLTTIKGHCPTVYFIDTPAALT